MKKHTLPICVAALICMVFAGCGSGNSDAGKLSEKFIHEKDGAEYLWLVVDAKDMYMGQYLADVIYFHAPTAIELAEKHDLKGSPLIEENTASQGNIVFFVREKNTDKDGWYRATTVEDLKRIRALTFEEYDKNHAGNEFWNFEQAIPEEVRSID
jgi:hypothetical protein